MKLTLIAALAAGLCAGNAFAQSQTVDPNSSFFQVDNYYAMTPGGDYERYQVAGYAQVPAPGASPFLFFLPTITVGAQDIQFFRVNGQPLDPRLEPNAQVGSITVKPRSVATMPTATQIPGIAATLKGEALSAFRAPAWKSSGQPVMDPQTAQWYGPAILQDYAEYERALAEQESLTQHYHTFQPRAATMQNLEVSLMIGDAVAASRTYAGSTSSMGAITLMAPTEFQVNQMIAGNFELLVTSRFRDTRTSYISARFDAVQAVHSFVEETQKAITKSKSSGFQVFGLGSRRSKMNTSINQTLKTDTQVAVMQNTSVVMYDATDAMVQEFENKFFPSLSKQEAIDRHLQAAAEASAAGNHELAKVHQDYADGIRTDNQMQEVDSVAAAAALNAGDYAGFIAHGVRALNTNDRKENSFRRVVNSDIEIRQLTNWDQNRTITAMREVSIPVTQAMAVAQRPRIGFCGMRYDADYVWIRGTWPQATPEKGLMVSCVEAGSPAAQAGLLPGMIVRFIGDQRVRTLADMTNALAGVDPGNSVDFYVLQGPTPQSPTSSDRLIRVDSKRGYP